MTIQNAKDTRMYSCERKVKYASPAKARHAARLRNNKSNKPGKIVTYLCPFCGFYHIGHEVTAERAKLKFRAAWTLSA